MAWDASMSEFALHQAAEEYLSMRRALGYKLENTGRLLCDFVDYLERSEVATVTVEHALAWAELPPGRDPGWCAQRLSVVRCFARYLHVLDPSAQVPPPGLLPRRTRRSRPYLYSQTEIVFG
jgi:integrase/recombinase XerD